MSKNTRVYFVGNDDRHYLIRATSRAQAFTHVARNLFECRVATQNDLILLIGDGVDVIDASTGIDAEIGNEPA